MPSGVKGPRKMASWYDSAKGELIAANGLARELELSQLCSDVDVRTIQNGETIVVLNDGRRMRYWPRSGTARIGQVFRWQLSPKEALGWLLSLSDTKCISTKLLVAGRF